MEHPDDKGATSGESDKESPVQGNDNNSDTDSDKKNENGPTRNLYPNLSDITGSDKLKMRDEANHSRWGYVILVYCSLLVVVIAVSIAIYLNPSVLNSVLSYAGVGGDLDTLGHFQARVKHIAEQFVNQDAKFWKEINAIGKIRSSEDEDKLRQPLVLTFVGFDNNADTVHNLARNVADAFSSSSPLYLEYIKDSNQTDLKVHFDNVINSHLEENERGVVFTKALNLFSYEDAAIFYKFCDQSDTKYPRAIFVFSLIVPREQYADIATSNMKTVVSVAERFLVYDRWGYISEELASALSVRVIDTVLYVNGEV